MSQQANPEKMLKRVFRVAEILASSESAYLIMESRKIASKTPSGKREKSAQKNTNS